MSGAYYDHHDTDPFEPVAGDEDEEDDEGDDFDFEDFGYAGGGMMPESYARISEKEAEERAKQYGEPTCELDIKIIRLLVFHPELNVRLRTGWQNILPENDKRLFLRDLRFALGVEPIGGEV